MIPAGMDRHTGGALEETAHIRQSITDILTTPVGSRVMRRDYGSLLPRLIDQPLNDATLLRAYTASVAALARWEPRIRVSRIQRRADAGRPGTASLSIDAITSEGEGLALSIPLAAGNG